MRCAGLEAFGLFGSDVKYYWDFYYMSVHTAGRIENNEKMSCDCAALRSAFDLLFSSSPTCLSLIFLFCRPSSCFGCICSASSLNRLQ